MALTPYRRLRELDRTFGRECRRGEATPASGVDSNQPECVGNRVARPRRRGRQMPHARRRLLRCGEPRSESIVSRPPAVRSDQVIRHRSDPRISEYESRANNVDEPERLHYVKALTRFT